MTQKGLRGGVRAAHQQIRRSQQHRRLAVLPRQRVHDFPTDEGNPCGLRSAENASSPTGSPTAGLDRSCLGGSPVPMWIPARAVGSLGAPFLSHQPFHPRRSSRFRLDGQVFILLPIMRPHGRPSPIHNDSGKASLPHVLQRSLPFLPADYARALHPHQDASAESFSGPRYPNQGTNQSQTCSSPEPAIHQASQEVCVGSDFRDPQTS
jgi:hypothetical protein